ncbi:MAG: 2-C-methyl-D-erythritol 2,4-cyclodiphosphate synthase [bacterium]
MIRVGIGYDAHRFAPGRPLVLGAVGFPGVPGLEGHSDGDVLLHAVCDAVLGAAGLPDIGTMFPPGDDSYKGVSSLVLLKRVTSAAGERGWAVSQVDSVVVAERPKIAPHVGRMRENIAAALGVPPSNVGVKATTTEGMGFEGRREGIGAFAVALLSASS